MRINIKKSALCLFICTALFMSGCQSYSNDTSNDSSQPLTEVNNADADALTDVTKLDKSLLSDYDYTRLKDKNITLNVCNWGEYMAVEDEEYMDVNKTFEEITGITVNYKTFASNEELYSKIKSGGASYDVIVPSDYMISRMIKEDILTPLDYNNIPNFEKYINKSFRNPAYDPDNSYTVPYAAGYVCIVYNKTMIEDDITGYKDLWNSRYSGQILMFNNPRDAFGIALTYLGYSQNTENKKELDAAADLLKEQKKYVQAYVMDEIFDKMEGGSAAIAPYYAGDVQTMIDDNPDLDYCVPEEGTNQFVDAFCIPKDAQNKEAAEMYINFMNEVQVCYANMDYLCYTTAHDGVTALFDEETLANKLRCPDQDYLNNKTEVFINLSKETNDYTQELWNQVKIEKSKSAWLVPALLIAAVGFTVFLNVKRARKRRQDIF